MTRVRIFYRRKSPPFDEVRESPFHEREDIFRGVSHSLMDALAARNVEIDPYSERVAARHRLMPFLLLTVLSSGLGHKGGYLIVCVER